MISYGVSSGVFDFDDIGAEVSHHRCNHRSGEEGGDVHDLETHEWACST